MGSPPRPSAPEGRRPPAHALVRHTHPKWARVGWEGLRWAGPEWAPLRSTRPVLPRAGWAGSGWIPPAPMRPEPTLAPRRRRGRPPSGRACAVGTRPAWTCPVWTRLATWWSWTRPLWTRPSRSPAWTCPVRMRPAWRFPAWTPRSAGATRPDTSPTRPASPGARSSAPTARCTTAAPAWTCPGRPVPTRPTATAAAATGAASTGLIGRGSFDGPTAPTTCHRPRATGWARGWRTTTRPPWARRRPAGRSTLCWSGARRRLVVAAGTAGSGWTTRRPRPPRSRAARARLTPAA
mmetsp:Transcript_17807/g.58174  ORF Transcript_17807/g.58174 Transcript_17807/m.58174 type:complete len:293 (+) Transcript_17807:2-880(+)